MCRLPSAQVHEVRAVDQLLRLDVLEVRLRLPRERSRMKELLERIVEALVDRPEAVQINEIMGAHTHVFELSVAREDLGKVIGKGGANASAIRTILSAASGKAKKRYILEILED